MIFTGSYIRRFGRLGLDLGVTAFLSYYLPQFAHLEIGSLAPASGLSHATQATIAAGLSMLAGYAVSPSPWWWGVPTSWPLFINADHPRAVVRRSGQRLAGTATGFFCGGLLATLTDLTDLTDLGTALLGALLLVAVFGIFTTDGRYGRVTFFITTALILTLELLNTSTLQALLMRMALTGLRTALGVIVAVAASFWNTWRAVGG